ncbi:HipA family kinase [Bacillus sp. 1P10SD]|uniref:HipA family kinase n=1 Tax=Bacillus sp. 1P10SD TaxID=3132265 RepID=UPI0039A48174
MITPIAYRKTLEGKSNAHLISFSDGHDYVVKFFQPGFERSLPNEWVGYCLARYLGLPIPFARLVEIPPEFIAQVPELKVMHHTQFQFASLYVPDCTDGHQTPSNYSISNHQSLAGVILLDYWLCNRDRTRKNIVLCEGDQGKYQLWIIDHAEIFGAYNWCASDLDNLSEQLLKSATHGIMATNIESEDSFTDYLDLIQTIPIFLIEEVVSMIPEDWMVTKEEKKAMVSALVTRRKSILPHLLQRFLKKVYHPLHEKNL